MAVDIDLKFATLQDPETCSLEELEAQIADLFNKAGFYETKQLAIKKFINSVYGALGSKYFVAYNTAMAESITAQGRDLNHFSEISVNYYFTHIWQTNPEITVYYQWVHRDKDHKKYTFKSEDKPEDYYNSGYWEECKSYEKAISKGKQMLAENKDCYHDNSVGHFDWFKIKTNLWDKMSLVHERCKEFDISKGKTTDIGPLVGQDFDYLEGATESMTVGGDTDSIYVEFGRIVNYCAPKSIYWGVSEETQRKVFGLCGKYPTALKDIPDENLRKEVHRERRRYEAQVLVDMWDYSLNDYMVSKYDEYAAKYNCDKNLQVLELEKIADVTLYFAKKRYAMSECWKEPGIFLPYMEEIIYKGIEIVKGTTPSYVRECMEDFVNTVARWFGDHNEACPYEMLIDKLKGYKKLFMTKSPEEICNGCSISNYEQFILCDSVQFQYTKGCPVHVRAAGVYNYFLNQPKNKKYKMKYQHIRSADKVKWYYSTDKTYEVFAFSPGQFPAEYALPIDREVQFEKTLLSFCNKVLGILNYPPMTGALCYSTALF